jgi:hypothetical protein
MSKRCEIQKEYYKEFGNYKGNGKYSDDYVKWLEDKVLSSSSVTKEYAEFCVRCDREGLPLLELDDYIEQYER